MSPDGALWPLVDILDVNDYLVNTTDFITKKQMKAYKSLDAHNYLTSGFVQKPLMKISSNNLVVIRSKALFATFFILNFI